MKNGKGREKNYRQIKETVSLISPFLLLGARRMLKRGVGNSLATISKRNTARSKEEEKRSSYLIKKFAGYQDPNFRRRIMSS